MEGAGEGAEGGVSLTWDGGDHVADVGLAVAVHPMKFLVDLVGVRLLVDTFSSQSQLQMKDRDGD